MVVCGVTLRELPDTLSSQVTVPAQLETTNCTVSPLQIVGLFTVGVGFGVTVTVAVAIVLHPLSVQVTS